MENPETTEERATRLAELLDAHALEAEDLRQVTENLMGEVAASNLFRMVVPQRFGGEGAGARELIDTTRTLATGCPSLAWVLSFLVMHNWLVTRFPDELQNEVFDTDRGYALMPAPLAPTGRLRATTGPDGQPGWRVNGRWEWATGVRRASGGCCRTSCRGVREAAP